MPDESRNSPREIQSYLGRVSGTLLDRINLHVEVPQLKFREISGDKTGETSAEIRARHRRAPAAAKTFRAQTQDHLQRAHRAEGTEGILCARRRDEGDVEDGDDGIKFQRPRLRSHHKSGANDCGFGRNRKHFQRTHFRGHPIPLARPPVVDVTLHERQMREFGKINFP
jgi:Magnesium chelatase, subunit ChlI